MAEAAVVRFEVVDGIGVITVDYPPVNALGPGVSDGIVAAVDQGEADPAVRAMVLIGAGRSFIAGADIRRFGKPRPASPRRSYDALDASTKPVVAAIHGYALGGGLENALCCHWRIAV
ncbi:MAG: fatty-acid oxidation protein subunit alpha, partial [Acetobacteraceae bacterium]